MLWRQPDDQHNPSLYCAKPDDSGRRANHRRHPRTPVRAIVELWRQGFAPEAIPQALPHLRLAQVFDALSYYSDNQDEIHAYIEKNRIPDELIDPRVK